MRIREPLCECTRAWKSMEIWCNRFSAWYWASLHIGLKVYEIDALSTGPFTLQFARSLALLTHLLALHCSLCSRAPLRPFICSLTHFEAREKVIYVYELNASISYHFNPLRMGTFIQFWALKQRLSDNAQWYIHENMLVCVTMWNDLIIARQIFTMQSFSGT